MLGCCISYVFKEYVLIKSFRLFLFYAYDIDVILLKNFGNL